MTVTRSSVPIRTKAFGMKPLPADCAEACLLTSGKQKPSNKPPLAETESLINSRRSIPLRSCRVLIGPLPSPPSRPRGGLPYESVDRFHSDKRCPSSPRQYPHRWVLVFRATERLRSSAVPIGSSRIGGRLPRSMHVAKGG